MNIGVVETSQASSASSPRRRRGSKGATNQPDRLNRRDIEFMHQTVSVVKKIGEFGTSYIYSAKDDTKKQKSGRSLLIKATAAGTTEEARRAEAEVRLFRKLSEAPGILKMIDCGFSTIDERVFDYGTSGTSNDDAKLDVRRLYCTLFEPCHDYFLSDFIKKRRRKYDKRRSRGLFARKKKDENWEGYLPLSTILDMFGQMASAVSALHGFIEDADPLSQDEKGENDEPAIKPSKGIVHLDIQPSRFLIRKMKEKSEEEDKYEVNLCSFGCSIRGEAPLTSNMDREDAHRMIESVTSPMYRSPEMVNLKKAEELNGSADVWGLGCCLYSLLFLTDCFKGHNKLDLVRGVFLIPANHPFDRKVMDVLARMLTVNSKERATIEEVLACIESLKEGKPLPKRRQTAKEIEMEREEESYERTYAQDLSGKSGKSSTMSNRSPGGTALHVGATDGDSDSARDDEEIPNRQNESLNDIWEGPPGEVSSDGTEFSQWLEFQPETADGSNLQHRTEPVAVTGPTTIVQRRGLRRRRRKPDPLNLGSASEGGHITTSGRKQPMFADWTLGLITQLSTRSLNPIETESEGGDSEGRDIGISPLREPSLRHINPYGHQSKTPKHPGSMRQHPYGSRYNLSHLPSLRVSDLMKDGIPHGVSTSSSEIHSSASNDIPGGSSGLNSSTYASSASDFFSSAELESSVEINSSASFTVSNSDLSASLPRTPLSESTRKALSSIVEAELGRKGNKGHNSIDDFNVETPATVPAGRLSIVSPNKGPTLPFSSQKEMISPRRNINDSPAFKRPPISRSPRASHINESQAAPKMKRSKSKKSKKKKSRKKRKSKGKDQLDISALQDGSGGDDVTCSRRSRSDSDAQKASIKSDSDGGQRASVTSNFSAPEFDPDTKDTDTDGDGGLVDQPTFGRRDTWGSNPTPGDWVSKDEDPTRALKSAMKKVKSEPARSFKADSSHEEVDKKFASSASDLDAWDLKAVEKWVTSKSQEASGQEAQKVKAAETKRKDPSVKRAESPSEGDVPKDWVKDAKLWVKSNSPTKVAQLRQEMTKELSNRSKPPSEVDASWFTSPAQKEEDPSVKMQTTDAAGFPMAPMTFAKSEKDSEVVDEVVDEVIDEVIDEEIDEVDDEQRAFSSKQLDRYLTPQTKKEKMKFSRSARSVNDLSTCSKTAASSKGAASSANQTPNSSRRRVRRSGREGKMLRTPSGFSQQTARTKNSGTQISVDSNLPPGDEVVIAEVSLPSATAEERTRKSMSVKEEVHMALTEEGRHMKRSIKKIEAESPYTVLSKMLLQEKEPEKRPTRSRSRPSSPERKKVSGREKMYKSTGAMKIPTMIELFTAENDDFPREAAKSPTQGAQRQFQTDTPKTISTWSGRSGATEPTIPSFMKTPASVPTPVVAAQVQTPGRKLPPPAPLLSPETPGGGMRRSRSKKKKKSKSHRKDREGVRKTKSERINRLDNPETPRATMGKSLTHLASQSESFKIDLVEAERAAKAQRKIKMKKSIKSGKSKSLSHRTSEFPGGLGDLVAKVEREMEKASSERTKWSNTDRVQENRKQFNLSFPQVIHARRTDHLQSPPSPLRQSPTSSVASIKKRKKKSKKDEPHVRKAQSARGFVVPETATRATKSFRTMRISNVEIEI